ncbi:hypothetical protein HanRHA438_Chr17g0801041 [Helianthus annuus]|nr:hypothetical protein HanHA89_Chr17g0696261 [Helianthus annuus]KAJ0825247.1 hypothetical protein HanRHA438_Chr17g0801041 [Helianthus annuus]
MIEIIIAAPPYVTNFRHSIPPIRNQLFSDDFDNSHNFAPPQLNLLTLDAADVNHHCRSP